MTALRHSHSTPPVRCRLIGEADLDAIVALLARGFKRRPERYWRQGIARHVARQLPEGVPRYGFMLEHEGRPVGVILTLYTAARDADAPLRCNLSSWYVEPAFRSYATLLDHIATRHKAASYLNISAAPHTWPMHEARGFRRASRGTTLVAPLLSPRRPEARLLAYREGADFGDLGLRDREILADHARYGCLSLVGIDRLGAEPLVFVRCPWEAMRNRVGWSPFGYFHLIYGSGPDVLPRFAHALGRVLLARHGALLIAYDGSRAVAGLRSRYVEGWRPLFARGPETPRLGDLSYTELALFGP